MKKLIFLLVSFPFFANAQLNVYEKLFGGAADDYPFSIEANSDGGYIVSGYTTQGGTKDLYLLRTDENADTVWQRTYGGTGSDAARFAVQTFDSGFAALGSTTSFGAGLSDIYLVKTAANGTPLWSKTYGGAGNDYGMALVEMPDSGFAILGSTESFGASIRDICLVRTDANGDTLWTKMLATFSFDEAWSIDKTSDGGFIIGGETRSVSSAPVMLIKLDASGNIQWSDYFPSAMYMSESVSTAYCRETPDHGYLLTYGHSASGLQTAVIKTDSTGAVQWSKEFYPLSWDTLYGPVNMEIFPTCLKMLSNGDCIISSIYRHPYTSYDNLVVRISPSGNIVWSSSFGTSEEERLAQPRTPDEQPLTNDPNYSWLVPVEGKFADPSIALVSFRNTGMSTPSDIYLVRMDMNGVSAGCNAYADSLLFNSFTPGIGTPVLTEHAAPFVVNSVVNVVADPQFFPGTFCSTIITGEAGQEPDVLNFWPNPVHDQLTISCEENGVLIVYDLLGEKIYEEELMRGKNPVDVSGWENGVYVLDFRGEHSQAAQKLVKE